MLQWNFGSLLSKSLKRHVYLGYVQCTKFYCEHSGKCLNSAGESTVLSNCGKANAVIGFGPISEDLVGVVVIQDVFSVDQVKNLVFCIRASHHRLLCSADSTEELEMEILVSYISVQYCYFAGGNCLGLKRNYVDY